MVDINTLKKSVGPKSVEELKRKGPPTREEMEAVMAKGAMGIAATDEEMNILIEYHARVKRADNLPNMLSVLYPNCEWSLDTQQDAEWKVADSGLHPGAIEALNWDEDNPLPKPTFAELKKLRPYVQDIFDQQAYLDLRQQNYPAEQDLIRALWEYIIEGNDEGVKALQSRRIAVKKRFPKPENKHWMVQSENYLKIFPNSPEDILRDIDEEKMKKIAFNPHLEAEDALPLSTKLSLEERMAKVLDARGSRPEEVINTNITLADVDAEEARLESKGVDVMAPIASDEEETKE